MHSDSQQQQQPIRRLEELSSIVKVKSKKQIPFDEREDLATVHPFLPYTKSTICNSWWMLGDMKLIKSDMIPGRCAELENDPIQIRAENVSKSYKINQI